MNVFVKLFLVALAPSIGLLLRGLVWGADSFAFMSVSCGQFWYASNLSSPGWFTSLLPFFSCNFYLIILSMLFFVLLGVWGLFKFGEKVFENQEHAFLLVLFTLGLCPLLFVEFLRFENQLYSFCLAFASVGLYIISQSGVKKRTMLFLCVITALIALSLWSASILVLFLIVLVTELPKKYQTGLLFLGIGVGTMIYWKYMLNSFKMILFQPMNLIGEEIPLIGLIFIIHLITFIKYVPRKYLPYTIILLFIGLVKVKFLFLATPFLVIGLIKKDLLMGIFIGKDKINLYPIAIIGLVGMIVLSFFMYPTQANVLEVQQAIKLAEDKNLELRNDWGDGWLVTWQGKYTPYKISNGFKPDLNGQGFIAYTSQDLNHCLKVGQKTFIC